MTTEERAAAYREMAEAMLGSIDSLVTMLEASPTAQSVFRRDPVLAVRAMAATLRERHVNGIQAMGEIVDNVMKAVPK